MKELRRHSTEVSVHIGRVLAYNTVNGRGVVTLAGVNRPFTSAVFQSGTPPRQPKTGMDVKVLCAGADILSVLPLA